MIIGVGIDVVDVERFRLAVTRTPRLLPRLFTIEEQRLPVASLAARFAVKEAVAKALGAPVGLHWTDAWVHRDPSGQPLLQTAGTVAARADALGVTTWHISMSHDAGIASAVAVAEARDASSGPTATG